MADGFPSPVPPQGVTPECIVCGGPHYYYGHLADALNREIFARPDN